MPQGSYKKDNKPRQLKFKSKGDKKKFLRSIEETEGVSLEDASSDDEAVVEQSLMQLDPVSSSEVLDEEGDSDLHILMVDPDPLLSETDFIMGESDPSKAIAESASLAHFESNISTEELDSAVNSISLEGEKITSLPEKADFASLSPTDPALMDSPLVAPVAPFKIEDNPFSPETYPVDKEMDPALPSPQGPVPTPAVTPLPQGHILVGGSYYQPVPAPHNVVVAQSMVPPPFMVPITPAEAPALPTDASIAPTESDAESIVVVASSDVLAPKAEGTADATPSVAGATTGSSATSFSTVSSEPKVDLEFALPKTPPPSRPAKKAMDSQKARQRSRQRSRSSSSSRSSSHQSDEVHASIPRGVNASDVPAPTLKRARGRGKIREPSNAPLIPTVPSPL